jgi:predicted secreted protein
MARAAKGTLLQVGNTATTIVYTTVGEVRDISGPAYSLETVEVTSHSSTGDYEEIVPTILRTGDVSFDINLDPKDATHLSTAAGGSTDGLFSLFENKTNRTMQLVVPASAGT